MPVIVKVEEKVISFGIYRLPAADLGTVAVRAWQVDTDGLVARWSNVYWVKNLGEGGD